MRRRALLMGGKPEPNTIIGGVGSVITTKSALATKLGISESIIRGFEVVGNDVHCLITDFYNLPVNCFSGDSNITSFIDYDGKGFFQTGTGAFMNSTIEKFESYNNSSLQLPTNFLAGSQVKEVIAPNVTEFRVTSIDGAADLHTIDAPNATGFWTYAARNTSSLINTNFKPTSLLQGAFQVSNAILDLSNLTNILQSALYNCKYITLDVPLLTSVSELTPFGANSLCVSFYANSLGSIGNSNNFFINWSSCELIEMKKLKTYGAYAAGGTPAQYGFSSLKTGCVIRVHEDLATANAGNPHEAFLYAKNTRGATVEFYDDSGNYVSTL